MKRICINFFYIVLHCSSIRGMEAPLIDKTKASLRYGFQNVRSCNNYEKAFLCVTKCLDLRYDVAHADKNCDCTCYHKKDKAKYTVLNFAKSTKWRLGTPMTSKPAWAHSKKDQDAEASVIEHQENIQNLSSNEHEADISNTTANAKAISKVTEGSSSVGNSTSFEGNNVSDEETTHFENKAYSENQENREIVEKEDNTENPDKNDNNENIKITESTKTGDNIETS